MSGRRRLIDFAFKFTVTASLPCSATACQRAGQIFVPFFVGVDIYR
jgi:hypothetical protein